MKLFRKKPCLGLSFCFPAAFFLFNPNISIIDIFPDFIGYFFLSLAFAKVGELNESIASAVAVFRRMILVDLGKWAAVIWVFGMTMPEDRNSSLLLWSFIFAVVEMVFVIPAFMKLFNGFTEIGYLYPNETLLEPNRKCRKSRTDKIKGATAFMIAAKGALSALPEFADLHNNKLYDETDNFQYIYRYIGVMRLFAFIPMLIIGIVWMVRFWRYIRRLRGDRVLWDGLAEHYKTDILPKTGMFICRNYKNAVWLIIIGIVFTMDFRLEWVNMLPDFIGALLFILAVGKLKKYLDLPGRRGWLGCVLYLFASGVEALCERNFFLNYTYPAIMRSVKADFAYRIWVGAVCAKNVMFLLAILSLMICIFRTISVHTGYVVGMERITEREETLVKGLHRELKISLIPVMVCAVIYSAADICFVLFDRTVGYMGMIHITVALIFLAFFVRSLLMIRSAVDTKYMLV